MHERIFYKESFPSFCCPLTVKHKHIFKTLLLCVNNSFHLLFHFLEISSSLFCEDRVVINAYFREIFKLFLALEYFYIELWSEINGEFSAPKIKGAAHFLVKAHVRYYLVRKLLRCQAKLFSGIGKCVNCGSSDRTTLIFS